jgi:hypothetical protein
MDRSLLILVLPMLGALLLFVINPGRASLRVRLLGMLVCSFFFAPFWAAAYCIFPDDHPWYLKAVWAFLFGPILLLTFAGIGSLYYFAFQFRDLVWRWWQRRRGRPAS